MELNTLAECLFGFLSSQKEKGFEYLEDSVVTDISFANEMLLSIAVASKDKESKARAKKIIKDKGSPLLKEVLKLSGKHKYKDYSDEVLTNIQALENIKGFSTITFALYLMLNNSSLSKAKSYFYENASEEELKTFFTSSYKFVKPEGIEINPFTVLPARAAQFLWNALPSIADRLISLECRTEGLLDLSATAGVKFPALKSLTVVAEFDSFPVHLYDLENLSHLTLYCNQKELPKGIAKLKNLKFLTLGMPLENLPEDLAELRSLTSLTINDTELESMPSFISKLSTLERLELYRNKRLKAIPQEVLEMPTLNRGDVEYMRLTYLPKDEFEEVYTGMKQFINFFEPIPLVKEIMEAYENSNNVRHLPELLIATARCYYDDEHGLSSNGFYFRLINEKAPEKVIAVNTLIPKPEFIDERTSAETLQKLSEKTSSIKGFDSLLFRRLIDEMVKATHAAYPFNKW